MASQDWVEKDFYAMLGVSKDASQDEIKKAYRKLARKYHPDTNANDPEAEKRFKEISEANSVIGDPEERKQYDAIRAMGSGARFTAGAGGPGGGEGFEDVFSNLFGGGGGRTTFRTGGAGGGFGGQNISFEDLFGAAGAGAGGSGGFPGYGTGGYGGGFPGGGYPGGGYGAPEKGADRTASTTIGFGSSLKGTRISLREPSGETIEVRIPAGIKDGQKVRVKGKGQQGPGGAGDLMVTVHVRKHPFFSRDGDDIRVTVPITVGEAALGGKVQVPTVSGKPVTLRVAPGTSSGKTVRVKERGVETKKGTGNMYVTFEIAVPDELSEEAKAAVEQFAEATKDQNPRKDLSQQAQL
ncbi:DnaJ C-terminal domain-containing protein [Arthrobacter sp. UM1]|uniref:DnaJ C-terminal domain-containing protein n=1 Tax=Arthrobacter sp. UM1 TaxID=2766776 RepID=UPI001CF6F86C|nr:DnaJ C-terminal domain-containing protein [Arthrobacter sp. UM1]MCB4208438.1 DnaJ domain-containing protein [Arthrobacter sp. UM1]